jgi:hypothetical protein
LSNTSLGIVCLTQDNKDKPWIQFESGALAKGLTTNRVCTFLIDLQPTDIEVQNPLSQFNHTLPNRDGLLSLVRTINCTLKDGALKESILEQVFNTYWEQFEIEFGTILSTIPAAEAPTKRKESDVLIELLNSVRVLDVRLRNIEKMEVGQPPLAIRNRIERQRITPDMISSQIEHLLKKGVSDDKILNMILTENGIPRNIIMREIDRVKSELAESGLIVND